MSIDVIDIVGTHERIKYSGIQFTISAEISNTRRQKDKEDGIVTTERANASRLERQVKDIQEEITHLVEEADWRFDFNSMDIY